MKNKLFRCVLSYFVLPCYVSANGISITGPACAVTGGTNGVYYAVSGPVQPSDQISWQVTGGIIVASKNKNLSGTIAAIGTEIRIIWNANARSGAIQVTNSRLGTAVFNVSVVTVDNSVTTGSPTINTGAAVTINGGGPDQLCETAYGYWWEVSDSSAGPFIPVDGARSQHLQMTSVKKRAYYRRVLCANGNNYYSNVILIDIAPASATGALKKD